MATVTYRHVKDPKRTLEVDASEKKRIEILDRSARWMRRDAPKDETPKGARGEQLAAMKVADLVKIAAEHGKEFPAVGTKKADVIEAILAAEFPEG